MIVASLGDMLCDTGISQIKAALRLTDDHVIINTYQRQAHGCRAASQRKPTGRLWQ